MDRILIFGAGKSATILIEYLGKTCAASGWQLTVFDNDLSLLQSKTRDYRNVKIVQGDIADTGARRDAINNADLVISMLPPQLHIHVAHDCLEYSKHLLTASYVDESLRSLQKEIENKDLLFLCEMGLDPGIDHMSAMKMLKEIADEGGSVTSFKSHCGGLVAPESDTNPWHYKITWNPMNVVMAGAAGAIFKKDRVDKSITYQEVFSNCETVNVPTLSLLAAYPNRDSLSYMKTYGLENVQTFIRTTLRYPAFCNGWNRIVNYGLTDTDDKIQIQNAGTYLEWFQVKSGISDTSTLEADEEFYEQASYLGLLQRKKLHLSFTSSAQIMRHLLETRLTLEPHDRDMIIMQHEIEYTIKEDKREKVSSLVVKGDDNSHTAMAKTVGLPLGIAAVMILSGKIMERGLRIPVSPQIYLPVLDDLEKQGIKFHDIYFP
jgi:saccharopine dehydrogenase (NADP+, L-glutamate forming)